MFRVDTPTAVATLADPEAAGTPGYFGAGNPATGTPASIPGRDWFNMIQEELMAVVLAASLTPAKNNRAQLLAAINALIVAALPTVNENRVFVSSATFEGTVVDGDAVRWDAGNSRFAKAVADGTANHNAVGLADVTGSEVTIYGEHDVGLSGLTPGARYYLDASTPGDVTATPPADRVSVGIAKSATVVFVDVDGAPVPAIPYDHSFIAGFSSLMTGIDLTVRTYDERVVGRAFTATGDVGYIGTAAVGAAAIFDVEKNGTSIYTTKPQFAAAANTLTAGTLKSDGTEIFAAGDRMTFKCTQIGSSTAGAGARFALLGTLN